MRKPEVLLIIAAVVGLIIGKLIKNFKWGMLIGVLATAVFAFVTPSRRKE